MKYIPTCMNFPFFVVVSLILFFPGRTPTSTNWSSAALCFWPSTLVLSAMCNPQSGLLDAKSLCRVRQQLIGRSHGSRPAPCLLPILIDCAVSSTRSLTLLFFHCVIKPPIACSIPMVSAANWRTPSPAFSAQMRTCKVSIWIVLASATTDFGNWEASHYIFGSRGWLTTEWWISNHCYIKHWLEVLNI